jgi:hypothetical protein
MPPEAKELLSLTRTDMILLLQGSSSSASVAIFSEGGDRIAKTTSGEPVDIGTARRMARDLLGSLASGAPKDGGAATVAARSTNGDAAGGAGNDDDRPASDKPKNDSKPDKPAETRTAHTTPATATASGSSGSDSTKLAVVIGLYGGAAALAAGGGILGFMAMRDQNEFSLTTTKDGKVVQEQTTDQIEGKAIADRGKRNALIADILYGTAGVVAITGIVIHLLWTPQPAATSVSSGSKSWSLVVGPGYGSLAVQF